MSQAWLLPVAVKRLHVGDLHAVGWGEDPRALVTLVKAIRAGVVVYKKQGKHSECNFVWGWRGAPFLFKACIFHNKK